MTNYPTLRIGVLRALQNLKRHYSADNEIFDRADCPYDMDVRAVLKEILTVEVRLEEKIVEKRVVNDGSAARQGKAAGLSEPDQEQIAEALGHLMEQMTGLEDEEAVYKRALLADFKLQPPLKNHLWG